MAEESNLIKYNAMEFAHALEAQDPNVSRKFLEKVYSENATQPKFENKYQLFWETARWFRDQTHLGMWTPIENNKSAPLPFDIRTGLYNTTAIDDMIVSNNPDKRVEDTPNLCVLDILSDDEALEILMKEIAYITKQLGEPSKTQPKVDDYIEEILEHLPLITPTYVLRKIKEDIDYLSGKGRLQDVQWPLEFN